MNIDIFDYKLLHNYKQLEMSVNGLTCYFHMPKALDRKFINGEEVVLSLPPGNPRPCFVVDEFKNCPESWMHGSSTASSYFVPIQPNHGIWLDMVENKHHTHHVAAVVSVQGINPLTGKKSDPIRLEQYKTKCPVHDVEFKQELFCEKCKHKWPPQNYISTNNGGELWLDGFMSEDGVVRQWIFTEEEAKGVAAQTIKQERVFAIGIAFYLSKEPKPVNLRSQPRGGSAVPYACDSVTWMSASDFMKKKGWDPLGSYVQDWLPDSSAADSGSITNISIDAGVVSCFNPTNVDINYFMPACAAGSDSAPEKEEKTSAGIPLPTLKDKLLAKHGRNRKIRGGPSGQSAGITNPAYVMPETRRSVEIRGDSKIAYKEKPTPIAEEEIKKLEVGAGAKIDQRIFADPQTLDFWNSDPAGFIYVNYCLESDAKRIISAGKRFENVEGFLTGLNLAK